MNEKLKNFFEKLIKEPELREKLASAKTAYEGYTKVKDIIEGVNFDEFKEALTEVHNKLEYRKKLLSSELTHVSGGAGLEILADVLQILSKLCE